MITATMVSSKESRLYTHAVIASRPTSAVKSAILPSTATKAGSQQAVRKLESRRSLRELSVESITADSYSAQLRCRARRSTPPGRFLAIFSFLLVRGMHALASEDLAGQS
jgi:hypothetical protein